MTSRPPAEAQPLVTFRLGPRDYATALAAVREVVRLTALADLPGMPPLLAGVLDVRGAALPVLDLRPDPGRSGDVLVLADGAGVPPVGVAVDEVRAVVPGGELPLTEDLPAAPEPGFLPGYVVAVLRGERGLVFLVDLRQMVAAAGRPTAAG